MTDAIEGFAVDELKRAGWLDKDGPYNGMLGEAVLNLLREFAREGHSGMSAGIAVNLFARLARFEPLTPLTGEDDEWYRPVEDDPIEQNKRCPSVFRGPDGRAYNISGRVFREPDGACFTSGESRVYVSFPYMPTTEYVDVGGPPA
jgi:hypothetical protein